MSLEIVVQGSKDDFQIQMPRTTDSDQVDLDEWLQRVKEYKEYMNHPIQSDDLIEMTNVPILSIDDKIKMPNNDIEYKAKYYKRCYVKLPVHQQFSMGNHEANANTCDFVSKLDEVNPDSCVPVNEKHLTSMPLFCETDPRYIREPKLEDWMERLNEFKEIMNDPQVVGQTILMPALIVPEYSSTRKNEKNEIRPALHNIEYLAKIGKRGYTTMLVPKRLVQTE